MGQRVKIVGVAWYPDNTFGHIEGIDVKFPIPSIYDGLCVHVKLWPNSDDLWFYSDMAHKHLEAVD